MLKKQVLTVGGNVNGGYSVLITGGITRDDKIAFPYGDTVKKVQRPRKFLPVRSMDIRKVVFYA